ncbi:class I SAM-dependent methyltransferase [Paenibacillus sp. ACRRY]|uniref:class I SAM-dependent methyltransferase n=1 Tax=Paenibacillus sp. ACRRY TaxID=2918208 RepID=UPI001EF59769|nr:class I SAM-dependent methyltransferase [Paenibacillus sp. ACRRY]MCG7384644.1 class I SAM-dependent methyltransferase [Paenibacillus sp. ACRRY]
MEKTIKNVQDLYNMLDAEFRSAKQFWEPFYENRDRPIPFFPNKPDENLVEQVNSGLLTGGKAMELGCGPGRNALYLTQAGYSVDAYDLSETAIAWAKERAAEMQLDVNFECRSVFELEPQQEYDLVYDSGCLHHLLPHQRIPYIQMITDALNPGGYFGMTCFAPGFGGLGGPETVMNDWEVYQERSMKGGLAFTEEKLRYLLEDPFECVELRPMQAMGKEDHRFGLQILWVTLWRKPLTEKRKGD